MTKKSIKLQELRSKEVNALQAEHLELLKELFNLKMQKGTGQLNQNHLIRNVKHTIAQILTVINEKQR